MTLRDYGDRIRNVATKARSEAKLEGEVNQILRERLGDFGIAFDPHVNETLKSMGLSQVDADRPGGVFGHIVCDYKAPEKLSSVKDLQSSKEQIESYLDSITGGHNVNPIACGNWFNGEQALGKHKPHKIRTLARAKGLKLAEVAERAGMKPNYLSRIISGSVNPTVATASRIAAALVSLSTKCSSRRIGHGAFLSLIENPSGQRGPGAAAELPSLPGRRVGSTWSSPGATPPLPAGSALRCRLCTFLERRWTPIFSAWPWTGRSSRRRRLKFEGPIGGPQAQSDSCRNSRSRLQRCDAGEPSSPSLSLPSSSKAIGGNSPSPSHDLDEGRHHLARTSDG